MPLWICVDPVWILCRSCGSHRLEDLLLSIFELPNLGDPRDFLQKMPDAPDKTRVDQAINRLLELNALKQEGQGQPKPTPFGKFLQKMPLDPDVGLLVMNGVRLQLIQDIFFFKLLVLMYLFAIYPLGFGVKLKHTSHKSLDESSILGFTCSLGQECAILAAVHQRGDPFLDSMNLRPEEVKSLWEVRDACSPGRGKFRDRPLPGDLMAGLGAYKAWQAKVKTSEGRSWTIQEEARWCAEHFLSLERLLELEEMVVQIHDVLEELGHACSLSLTEKEKMRQRRKDKGGTAMALWIPPRLGAAQDLRPLLQQDRDTELLLAWCIAASFISGLIEVKYGSSTQQLKYRAKKGRSPEVGEVLRHQGFRVTTKHLKKGDVEVTFQNGPEEAHKAYQIAQLVNNKMMPWKDSDPWGRPQLVQRTSLHPRQCYQGLNRIRIRPSSQAWLPTTEDTGRGPG